MWTNTHTHAPPPPPPPHPQKAERQDAITRDWPSMAIFLCCCTRLSSACRSARRSFFSCSCCSFASSWEVSAATWCWSSSLDMLLSFSTDKLCLCNTSGQRTVGRWNAKWCLGFAVVAGCTLHDRRMALKGECSYSLKMLHKTKIF